MRPAPAVPHATHDACCACQLSGPARIAQRHATISQKQVACPGSTQGTASWNMAGAHWVRAPMLPRRSQRVDERTSPAARAGRRSGLLSQVRTCYIRGGRPEVSRQDHKEGSGSERAAHLSEKPQHRPTSRLGGSGGSSLTFVPSLRLSSPSCPCGWAEPLDHTSH